MDDFTKLFSKLLGVILGAPATPNILARTETEDGLIVSTVITVDKGPETAILDANGTHPVERYGFGNEAKAIEGHERWVKVAKSGTTITKLGYEDLIEPCQIVLEGGLR